MYWKVRDIVAVHGCKGGVGKSTVAAGLALALKDHGCTVGICDLDIYGPNIAYILGADESYVKWRRVELEDEVIKYDSQVPTTPIQTQEASSADEILRLPHDGDEFPTMAFGKAEPITTSLLEPKVVHGIKLMSFAFIKSKQELGYAAFRGPVLDQIASELVLKTDWGDLDYLILDLPPGTGDVIISIIEDVTLSGLVAVSTPHELGCSDLMRGLGLFRDHQVSTLCLVENMSYFTCDGCSKLHHPFGQPKVSSLATSIGVANYVCLPVMANNGSFVDELASNADASRKFSEIAKAVMANHLTTKTASKKANSEALGDGLDVPERRVPCASANKVDGLVDSPEWRHIDSLPAYDTG
ncbi:MRP family domain-containing protein [Babesia ovata]|uniref:MRP family domain-containing protein n=1 Tax=Babesia ovata TaxID=189622 RepID=A0A2H6KI93_9APIC|nr:MRP family domain-containing protein [Babesia ovata]GBE62710.1 MRP family domain-containing protein [Babesia ovata]